MDEISQTFYLNQKQDLDKFLTRRARIGYINIMFLYLFHIIQASGIFCVTLGTAYKWDVTIWTGVGLNILAQVINAWEKINESIAKTDLANIQHIHDGSYIDEELISKGSIDREQKFSAKQPLIQRP